MQRRSNVFFAHFESLRAAESASQPAEDHLSLIDAMEYASLHDPGHHSFPLSHGGSSSVWMEREGRPPGSSGSEMDGPRESRSYLGYRRDLGSSRQVSDSSEATDQPGTATMRTTRNGNTRKFLSGFMRKARTASPDAASSPAMARDREWEREFDRDRISGRDRNKGPGLPE
jgi:hypothetical protein